MVTVPLKEWQKRAPYVALATVVLVVFGGRSFSAEATDKCFKISVGKALPEPLTSPRCKSRYASLDEAKTACAANTECTGIGHDHGIEDCGSDKKFELRKSKEAVGDSANVLTWVAGECSEAAKLTWPGSSDDIKALIASSFEGFTETKDGVYSFTFEAGTGAAAQDGDKIVTNFAGYLVDGTKYRSTYDDALKPEGTFSFVPSTGQAIKGFDIAGLDMKQGEKRVVLIPPEYAYKEQGDGGPVPGDAWVIYFIELVELA